MNLFWKKVFGGLTPTDKLEKEEEDLLLAYKRYCDIQTSEQLAEYTKLFHLIKAADFKEKKKTLQNRKFKDTEEYRDFRKYQKLHSSSKLKLYYEELDSPQLKEFLEFKETPDYKKLGDPKIVKEDEVLKKFKVYEKSKAYKNYIRFHNSFVVTEYEKLKEHVSTDEFLKSKNFWEDKNRWKKTEEYKIEQRYYELQKTSDIAFYESTDPKQFEVIDQWALTFEDNFDGTALGSKWSNGYYHRAQSMRRNYSFSNEKQAYSEGKNIFIDSSLLKINTIADKKEGLAWDAKKGFIKKEFDFSSDIINTGESFQQQGGLIKAKIAVKGSKDISHAFWLGTDGKLPHINIFHFNGKKIAVSSYLKGINNIASFKETITGLNPSKFYIYSLEWTRNELIWRINNIEVCRTKQAIPTEKMFPVFNSFIAESQKGGSGSLEVDWIKIYSVK